MPHVVTQSCVGDGSCVYACPVNCIQPTPDDAAFELAEMLHVDPTTCVDCGACVSACPVDAIKPHTALSADEEAFALLNAAYHETPRARPLMAPVHPPLTVRDRGEPLRVAIVGSGPAAMYAAEELLTIPGARVSVLERLDRPYGLVHSGIAPDHRRTRRVSRQLERIRDTPGLTMHLGVEVGRDVTHEELLRHHHAVIYAVGAASDRRLEIPGAGLPGVFSATELVGWYNGHPDHAERTVDLSHERAVIVGNGNVALDVARVLTTDPSLLQDSEIAPHALEALRASRIREVVVLARRGPERSAFTLPELVGLRGVPGVAIDVEPGVLDGAPTGDAKMDVLRDLAPAASGDAKLDPWRGPDSAATGDVRADPLSDLLPAATGDRTIALRWRRDPLRISGAGAAEAVVLARTADGPGGVPVPTGEVERLEAGLVVTSIGYRGVPVGDLPYDDVRGVVPNAAGRVVDPVTAEARPGTYVVGWIKRGPSGFIGTNKRCAQETVAALVDDLNAGRLPAPQAPPRRRTRLRAIAERAVAAAR